MKKIIITERQYRRLFKENGPLLSNGNDKEHSGNGEISSEENVSDDQGDSKRGNPTTTNNISSKMTNQGFWYTGGKGRYCV